MTLPSRRTLLVLELTLLVAFVGSLFVMRRGAVSFPPAVLVTLCVALLLLFAFELVVAVVGRNVAGALLAAGVLLLFGGGMANWLFRLQGFVILTEIDAVPLAALSHLQGFDAGPFSNAHELAAMLQLEKCELQPAGDGFVPVSHLRLLKKKADAQELIVRPGAGRSFGTLRFHQGTFGFAPRLVITRDDATVFDRVVPFTTRSPEPGVLSFNGVFDVVSEKLRVDGAVSLDTLDERMRGHVKLGLVVSREGRELGRGELLPGHFADLADGYRIGFAGVKKWSEIDISRRNYPQPMIAGVVLIVAGVLAPLLRRRR